jgi:hypothetical protein
MDDASPINSRYETMRERGCATASTACDRLDADPADFQGSTVSLLREAREA